MSFPYKKLFVTESPSEIFQRLVNLPERIESNLVEFGSDIYTRVNIITDLFTEDARVIAKFNGFPSPLEFWKANEEAIRKEANIRFGNESIESLREAIYFMNREATAFSPSLSKVLIDEYLKQPGKIFDPFSGWGDRAIGSIAAKKTHSYIGIDNNENLRKGYEEITSFANEQKGGTVTFQIEDVQKATLKFQKESFDLIITSPPFFDVEEYRPPQKDESEWVTAAPKKKMNFSTWFRTFLTPILIDCVRILKKKGTFVIYVANSKTTPYFVENVTNILKKAGCKHIQKIDRIINGKKTLPVDIFQKL